MIIAILAIIALILLFIALVVRCEAMSEYEESEEE